MKPWTSDAPAGYLSPFRGRVRNDVCLSVADALDFVVAPPGMQLRKRVFLNCPCKEIAISMVDVVDVQDFGCAPPDDDLRPLPQPG